MDLDLILRLERKIDELLDRNSRLTEECRRLQAAERDFLVERERFCEEIDRILVKLEQLDKENV